MWVDDDGVLHTAAAEDPRVVIGGSARRVIRSLRKRERRAFLSWLEQRTDQLYDELEDAEGLPREGEVALWPDEPLLPQVADVEELRAAFEQVPVCWQLDVLNALDDVTD